MGIKPSCSLGLITLVTLFPCPVKVATTKSLGARPSGVECAALLDATSDEDGFSSDPMVIGSKLLMALGSPVKGVGPFIVMALREE